MGESIAIRMSASQNFRAGMSRPMLKSRGGCPSPGARGLQVTQTRGGERHHAKNDIRNSTGPIALAASFPSPTPGDAMDDVRLGVDRSCLVAGIEALRWTMLEDATAAGRKCAGLVFATALSRK